MAENTGITAIFGANSEAGVSVVRSLADAFKIPYLFAVNEIPVYEDSVAINIYPKSDALTMVRQMYAADIPLFVNVLTSSLYPFQEEL